MARRICLSMVFLNGSEKFTFACFLNSVACLTRGGQRGAVAPPPIITKDEFCDSSKSVEKLMVGGKLHFLQHLWQRGLSMLLKKQE